MAKLALLFIVIFCIMQFTVAARLRRDTLEDGIDALKNKVGEVLNKETVDSFLTKLSEFGSLIKTKGEDLFANKQSTPEVPVNKE
uniref:Putative salivary secreted peptide n=1 Tax=Anopheles nuneztovari TaxID=30067 RepID=A0A2M3YWE6_9DIPT